MLLETPNVVIVKRLNSILASIFNRRVFPGKAVQDLVIKFKAEEVEKLKTLVPQEDEKNVQLSQQLEAYQKQAVVAQDPASVAAIFAKVIPADFILDESFNCNTNNFPVGLDLDPGLT
ncbi:unnamed protein product [Sphagnum jensenii]|uniref:Uncharacterized protein n=1 Tax=Sphagnum jensenii TaxID=128206 RepID=A0ABP0VVI9_9BRYO